MEAKKENLFDAVVGTLLIASALINFAEFNIEHGFCDYWVLVLSILVVLASVVLAIAIMTKKSFWLLGIGTLILLLCRLHELGRFDYIYMTECVTILVILVLYILKIYKYKTLNLDWSYLIGIVFCAIWFICQVRFIKSFMNREMLQETAILKFEACQKGFCYLLEEIAITGLLLAVIRYVAKEEKNETGLTLSRCLSIMIAAILFIVASWNIWVAIFAVPRYFYINGWGTTIFRTLIFAAFVSGLVHMGAALIKSSRKLLIIGALLLLPDILLSLSAYLE